MIQPNELRIGNFVYQSLTDMTESIYHAIRSIGEKCVSTNELNEVVPFNKLDGIPLTPEILEKCGWVWNENLNIFEKPGDTRMDLQYRSVSGSFTMLNSVIGALIAKRIFFLHQLQNLYFALSGEELTVNL